MDRLQDTYHARDTTVLGSTEENHDTPDTYASSVSVENTYVAPDSSENPDATVLPINSTPIEQRTVENIDNRLATYNTEIFNFFFSDCSDDFKSIFMSKEILPEVLAKIKFYLSLEETTTAETICSKIKIIDIEVKNLIIKEIYDIFTENNVEKNIITTQKTLDEYFKSRIEKFSSTITRFNEEQLTILIKIFDELFNGISDDLLHIILHKKNYPQVLHTLQNLLDIKNITPIPYTNIYEGVTVATADTKDTFASAIYNILNLHESELRITAQQQNINRQAKDIAPNLPNYSITELSYFIKALNIIFTENVSDSLLSIITSAETFPNVVERINTRLQLKKTNTSLANIYFKLQLINNNYKDKDKDKIKDKIKDAIMSKVENNSRILESPHLLESSQPLKTKFSLLSIFNIFFPGMSYEFIQLIITNKELHLKVKSKINELLDIENSDGNFAALYKKNRMLDEAKKKLIRQSIYKILEKTDVAHNLIIKQKAIETRAINLQKTLNNYKPAEISLLIKVFDTLFNGASDHLIITFLSQEMFPTTVSLISEALQIKKQDSLILFLELIANSISIIYNEPKTIIRITFLSNLNNNQNRHKIIIDTQNKILIVNKQLAAIMPIYSYDELSYIINIIDILYPKVSYTNLPFTCDDKTFDKILSTIANYLNIKKDQNRLSTIYNCLQIIDNNTKEIIKEKFFHMDEPQVSGNNHSNPRAQSMLFLEEMPVYVDDQMAKEYETISDNLVLKYNLNDDQCEKLKDIFMLLFLNDNTENDKKFWDTIHKKGVRECLIRIIHQNLVENENATANEILIALQENIESKKIDTIRYHAEIFFSQEFFDLHKRQALVIN